MTEDWGSAGFVDVRDESQALKTDDGQSGTRRPVRLSTRLPWGRYSVFLPLPNATDDTPDNVTKTLNLARRLMIIAGIWAFIAVERLKQVDSLD